MAVYLYVNEKDYIYGYGSEREADSVLWEGDFPSEFDAYLGCYKYNNGNFILDEKKKEYLVNCDKFSTEGNAIINWFSWYDQQVAQYNRCQRLGIEFDKDINELDAQAAINQARLAEIKAYLNTPYVD